METDRPDFTTLALQALERLQAFAQEKASTAETFTRWGPVVSAVQGLGFTLFQFGNHLVAVSQNDELDLMPPDLADELRADLDGISASFPGIDEVIFGTEAIDSFIDGAIANDSVRTSVVAAFSVVGEAFDRVVGTLIEMAMNPEAATLSHEQMAEYLGRFERVFQKMIEGWLGHWPRD